MAKRKTFEDNVDRLNDILEHLSAPDVSMSETIKLYKEGLDLIVTCSNALNKFEQEVTELKIKAEENLQG